MHVIGWFLLCIGIIGFGVEIQDLVAGTATDPILGFILSTMFSGGGLALIRRGLRRRRERLAGGQADPAALEPRIFRFAAQRGGRVSAVEVSAALDRPFEESRQALQALADKGACQVIVTEEGATLYRFAELEGAGARRDLLEE